jgi:hypothetical protein
VLGDVSPFPRPKSQERGISRQGQGTYHWRCEQTVPPVGRQVDRTRLAVDAARTVILVNRVSELLATTDRAAIAVSRGTSWWNGAAAGAAPESYTLQGHHDASDGPVL